MHDDPFTAALHADAGIDDGPDVAPPIRMSTTFDRTSQSDLVYRRDHHRTTERLEAVLGALEGGFAVAYPSGMAAVAAVLRRLQPRRIALPADVYHGTRSFVLEEASRGAWSVVDEGDLAEGDVRWVETPSNPRVLVTDIAAAAARAAGAGATVIVDSTFATPVLQRPLELGARFVVHATTKAIAGHSDAMGGVVATASEEEAASLLQRRGLDGSIPGGLDVWLTLRGVRTLPLRVERQSATAHAVAAFLEERVPRVWYPGLAGHPGHEVAARQMRGYGGMLSFEMESFAAAAAVAAGLRLFRRATSLGGVESLAEHRRVTDPSAPAGLIRLSIGLEAAGDLVADLGRALD